MTAVDIWARKSFSEDEIKLEHDSHMYPPRVTVKFRWKNLETYPKFCTIPVAVTGSNSSLDDEVNLPFGEFTEIMCKIYLLKLLICSSYYNTTVTVLSI